MLKSNQIAKYKSLSSNIILTDYLDFVWINKYGPAQRERLCHATDFENRKFRLPEDRVEAVVGRQRPWDNLRVSLREDFWIIVAARSEDETEIRAG